MIIKFLKNLFKSKPIVTHKQMVDLKRNKLAELQNIEFENEFKTYKLTEHPYQGIETMCHHVIIAKGDTFFIERFDYYDSALSGVVSWNGEYSYFKCFDKYLGEYLDLTDEDIDEDDCVETAMYRVYNVYQIPDKELKAYLKEFPIRLNAGYVKSCGLYDKQIKQPTTSECVAFRDTKIYKDFKNNYYKKTFWSENYSNWEIIGKFKTSY